MKGDFTRLTFRHERRYSSVRMQQGRVQLDADWNEQVDIQDHLRQTALRDVIGECCIPQAEPGSFEVTVGNGDLTVAGGRIWVQGVLCQEEEGSSLEIPEEDGRYAVFLEVWQRHVTAIDDPNIREVALGGPDHATRTETTCQVRLSPVGDQDDCADDWAPPDQTDGEMTAGTAAEPVEDPCLVPEGAGYSRLESQLYRVEVNRSGQTGGPDPPTFKWSRDNGSVVAPWLETDGDAVIIDDSQTDDVRGFQDNRWIELVDDSTALVGEPGTLVEVTIRSTDEQGRLRLEIDPHGQTVGDAQNLQHPQVRRWDQDSNAAPNEGDVEIVANTPIDLEGGIQVEFSAGFYRSGDYWLIPARTFVGDFIGDILWPRDTLNQPLAQPPCGVERHYCRLAVVAVDDGEVQVVEDCRTTFPTLCGLETETESSTCCCTVTVGPGGQFDTIAEGLAALPSDGGELCLLRGTYQERIDLTDPRNLVIRGCGPQSRIVNPDGLAPAIRIRNGQDVSILSLAVESLENVGIDIRGPDLIRIRLEDLEVTGRDTSAVVVRDGFSLSLLDSRIEVRLLPFDADLENAPRQSAVFFAGQDLLLEGNRISSQFAIRSQGNRLPGGGLQIGGGSIGVEIRRNRISGGMGTGVVLGSVTQADIGINFPDIAADIFDSDAAFDPDFLGARLQPGVDHFAGLERQPGFARIAMLADGGFFLRDNPFPPDGGPVLSDGDLSGVRIIDNQIRDMGRNGIGVAHFFDLQEGGGDFISVDDLEIDSNRIEGCLNIPREPRPESLLADAGDGGIALADGTGIVIRDNDIQRNGTELNAPASGVFILHGRGVEIGRNRIRHNGFRPDRDPEGPTSPAGQRGGIVCGFVQAPSQRIGTGIGQQFGTRDRQDGTPAATIYDNVVVASQGRALQMVALGPVSIHGNQFTSLGSDLRNRPDDTALGLNVPADSPLLAFADALGGAVVWVFNLGVSNEIFGQLLGFAGLGIADELAQPEEDDPLPGNPLAGGNILFNDNQGVLDALNPGNTLAFSSVALLCLDDIGMRGNQCDSDLLSDDFLVSQLLAWGFSVRSTSNRFKEGALQALLSATTIGQLNTTTDNQGTHCFLRVAPVLPSFDENTVLAERFQGNACRFAETLQGNLRAELFPES